ncbi:hypothetical protein V5799_009466 [Amblyomma americanum]|uniref:FP protein C-terminal domain-containing protein n=1 Tax=Amblyomma americanum TaxID=6943 RepID=A0AAQ4FAQ6_AMBAM
MSVNCFKCNEPVESDDASVVCTEWFYSFHVGKSRQTPKEKKSEEDGVDAIMFANLVKQVNELSCLKATVADLEASVEMMSSKYDELLARVDKQDQTIESLLKRVEKVEGGQQVELRQLKEDMNTLEQHSRALNLEIHGVQSCPGENLLSKVNEVAEKIKLPAVTQQEVNDLHRLPAKGSKIPIILVRFANKGTRDEWLRNRNELRTDEKCCIYLNENLTKRNRQLLQRAKTWADDHGFRFAWYRHGRIYVRKESGETAYLIKDECDLDKIVT